MGDSVHICGCGKTFKNRSGIFKHSKKCDKSTTRFAELSRKPCREVNCQYSYRYIEELRNHLETVHNLSIVTETLFFESYEVFLQWKEEYEFKTLSSFTRNNIRTGAGRSTEYYYCHRSGQYKSISKGKRKLKAQGSLKINTTCTAALKVTYLPNSAIKLFVCHTHYGHKMEMCHIKIPKRDRELVASQLNNGVPKEKILHTLSPGNAVTLERKHLIMRKDLNNISRAFGVKRQPRQHRLNVEDFFQEVTCDGTAFVLLYKRRKEDVFMVPENVACPFRSQDYVFAFMNQFQKEVFEAHGNGVICFDVTTDCGGDQPLYKDSSMIDMLKIFSVLVIDEYGDGIPAAWLISNRDDTDILTLFFQQIKDKIGSVTPKAILTDRTSEYYKCWTDVFDGETVKLLCSWHVYSEWQEKLSLIEDQHAASLCYQVLCLLLEEQDMAKFVILMQRCIKEMNDNESLVGFGRYFGDEWAVIQDQWASCFRNNLGVETNCHFSSIHQVIRHQFMQEKYKKSPNKCLSLVLNVSSDINMKRHEKHETEKAKILESHRTISTMSLDIVKQVNPNTWYVTAAENVCNNTESSTSGGTYSLVYVVEEIAKSCTKVCNVKCAFCQICMHLYKCSCKESKPGTDICEHSHLVALFVSNQASELETNSFILGDEPNHVDFGMLDHNYYEVALKENHCGSRSSRQDHQKCAISAVKTELVDVTSEGISVASSDVQKCLGIYTIPKAKTPPPIPIQLDRRLGVPILPKPPKNTATLLGIIIIPNSSNDSDSSVETLQSSLVQNINTLVGKIKTCSNKETLLALKSHIDAAKSALEVPNNKT